MTSPAHWHRPVGFGYLREMARTFGGLISKVKRGRVRYGLRFRIEGEELAVWSVPTLRGRRVAFGGDRAAALEELEAIRAEVRQGHDPLTVLAPYLTNGKARAFRRYWGEFVIYQGEKAAAGQISKTRARVISGHEGRGYLDPLLELPIDAIEYGALEDLQRHLQAKPLQEGEGVLSPKSVQHVLTDVRTCLRWLARRKVIRGAPEVPVVRVPDHVPDIPTEEMQARVLVAIPEPERGIFLARGRMGLRNGEAARALLTDYRRGDLVDDDGQPRDELVVRGKGGRVRVLPVPVELAVWVRKWRPGLAEAGTLLFPNPKTEAECGPWSESAQRRTWKAAEKAAKIGHHYKPNEALRHCFGTRRAAALLGSGYGREDVLRMLREYMGHTSVKSSERYVKLGAEILRGVLR